MALRVERRVFCMCVCVIVILPTLPLLRLCSRDSALIVVSCSLRTLVRSLLAPGGAGAAAVLPPP